METLFVGRNIIFLPEIDSTNSYAINLLKNVKVSEGSVIHTAHQSSGRGQRGNSWNSSANENLTVSIVLKPSFLEIKNQFVLYQLSALACYDVMSELLNNSQFDIKIKWPNDIMVNNKKIAGILIENIIQQETINWAVIGIGININQTEFDTVLNATSLKNSTMQSYEIQNILSLLCTYIEKYYLLLKNDKLGRINELYSSHFFKKGQWHDFSILNEIKNLKVIGTSDNGLLLLENSQGVKKEYDIKDLKWVL